MTEIVSWIDAHNLKQAQAAEILGITRPRVSDVVNQKTPKFTVDSLVGMVFRTGKHVQLPVQRRFTRDTARGPVARRR